jgi:membrane protease YdiL (CAAX protease family)
LEPENQPHPPETSPAEDQVRASLTPGPFTPPPDSQLSRGVEWVFLGSHGLRAGWAVLIACLLFNFFKLVAGTVFFVAHLVSEKPEFAPRAAFFGELIPFLAMVGAVAIAARLQQCRILDFNLTGPRRSLHFLSGLAFGFAAISALVDALAWGGWLSFGPVALSGAEIPKLGALWAAVFLLVGCVEEGTFRCYLQFTLTRGINFWWALGAEAAMCLDLVVFAKGNGVWGVYAIAIAGLAPCLWLHLKKTDGSAFWQAAWITSTFFGFIHTGNNGENWIGIFAAAAIGFVFCVSVRVTGSAWWAIGCHASWDWAETYFYGTADSGMVAQGHYFSTTPAGNALWSGGTDGPEGSLLVLGVILLLLLALLAIYGNRRPAQ